MTLKELLEVVPDNYPLGLMDSDPDNYSILVFGNKKDIIFGFSQRTLLMPEQIKNLKVVAIHPGAKPYLPDDIDMYGDDAIELHVITKLLIVVSPE
jgi:hypothetical protein